MVVVLDGQQAIGQAEATPTGLWSQAITLTNNAQSGTHLCYLSESFEEKIPGIPTRLL